MHDLVYYSRIVEPMSRSTKRKKNTCKTRHFCEITLNHILEIFVIYHNEWECHKATYLIFYPLTHNSLITIIVPSLWSRRRRHHHLDNRATGINPETLLLCSSLLSPSLDLMRGKTKCRWVSGNGASAASLKGASSVRSGEWTRFICNS